MNTLEYGLAGAAFLIAFIFLFTKIKYALIRRRRRLANIQRFDKHMRPIEILGNGEDFRPRKKKMFFHVM
jgi:hypothetical protein